MKVILLVIWAALLALQCIEIATKLKGVPTPDWVDIAIDMLKALKCFLQLIASI